MTRACGLADEQSLSERAWGGTEPRGLGAPLRHVSPPLMQAHHGMLPSDPRVGRAQNSASSGQRMEEQLVAPEHVPHQRLPQANPPIGPLELLTILSLWCVSKAPSCQYTTGSAARRAAGVVFQTGGALPQRFGVRGFSRKARTGCGAKVVTVVLDSFAHADSPIEPEEYIETPPSRSQRATTIASPNPGNSTAISRKELTARGAHVVTVVSGYVAVADAPAEPKSDGSRSRSHRDASPREQDARRKVRRKREEERLRLGHEGRRHPPRARASPRATSRTSGGRRRGRRAFAREFDEDCGRETVAFRTTAPMLIASGPHRAYLPPTTAPRRRMAGPAVGNRSGSLTGFRGA